MERVTFPQAEVMAALQGIALARLDIDLEANVAACRRWHGHDGVPAFVLLDPRGDEVHRWVGGGEAERFLGELRTALAGKVQGGAEDTEQARWTACDVAHKRGDWAALRAAGRRYLELPAGARAAEVRVLLDVAEFETTGRTTPELQAYIDACIAVIAAPTPGTTLEERVGRLLGKESSGASFDSDAFNKAMNELQDVGRASAASLRHVLLHKPGAAFWAAIVLARLRLPETTPWLCERLRDDATPAWAHRFLVSSIAAHKEERCLPVLIEWAGQRHPAPVRAEAVGGIKSLLVGREGPTRADVAEVIGEALEARDRHLLGEVLQAAFEVQAPLSLDRLVDLLDDQRQLGWGDYRICDNALWILTHQLGMNLERADGTGCGEKCTREVAAWLRAWHAGNATSLRWNAEAKCYRTTGKQ